MDRFEKWTNHGLRWKNVKYYCIIILIWMIMTSWKNLEAPLATNSFKIFDVRFHLCTLLRLSKLDIFWILSIKTPLHSLIFRFLEINEVVIFAEIISAYQYETDFMLWWQRSLLSSSFYALASWWNETFLTKANLLKKNDAMKVFEFLNKN